MGSAKSLENSNRESHMQYKVCDLCSTDDTRTIAVYANYKMVECNNCGLVYMNPRPTQQRLVEMYQGYHQRSGKNNMSWSNLMKPNFEQTAAFLSAEFPSTGRLLDVGCGYGYFLSTMQSKGWDVMGIEPSDAAASFAAHQLKMKVVIGTIDGSDLPLLSFDAVTAFYVLEHLMNPALALKKIYDLLKPGGVLVIRIPDTAPIVKLLSILRIQNNLFDMPFHLYDFSSSAISKFLKKAGFTDISTVPGSPTVPESFLEKVASLSSHCLCRYIWLFTSGRCLLPGVSKTIIARKPKNCDSSQGEFSNA